MPIERLGSRLYLVKGDGYASQHSEVIVFVHGGEITGRKFDTRGGPTIRFYFPQGRTLYTAAKSVLRDFKGWSDRVQAKQPEWTFAPQQVVTNYSLSKATGYHLGYEDLAYNKYPSQHPSYFT